MTFILPLPMTRMPRCKAKWRGPTARPLPYSAQLKMGFSVDLHTQEGPPHSGCSETCARSMPARARSTTSCTSLPQGHSHAHQ